MVVEAVEGGVVRVTSSRAGACRLGLGRKGNVLGVMAAVVLRRGDDGLGLDDNGLLAVIDEGFHRRSSHVASHSPFGGSR